MLDAVAKRWRSFDNVSVLYILVWHIRVWPKHAN